MDADALSSMQANRERQRDERNEYDRTLKKKNAAYISKPRQFLKDRSLPLSKDWVPRMRAHFKDIGFSNNPDLAPSHRTMATGEVRLKPISPSIRDVSRTSGWLPDEIFLFKNLGRDPTQ